MGPALHIRKMTPWQAGLHARQTEPGSREESCWASTRTGRTCG